MKLGKTLLARLGFFARKVEVQGPDAFDLRLQRIGVRERRYEARAAVFKTLSEPLAA